MNRETCISDCWDWITEADFQALASDAFRYARDLIEMPEQLDGEPVLFDDRGTLWADRSHFAQYLAEGAFKAVGRLAQARGIAFDPGDSSANLSLERP